MAVVPLYDTLGLEAMIHILNLGETDHVVDRFATRKKLCYISPSNINVSLILSGRSST